MRMKYIFHIYLDKTTDTNNKRPNLPVIFLSCGELAPSMKKHHTINFTFPKKLFYPSISPFEIFHYHQDKKWNNISIHSFMLAWQAWDDRYFDFRGESLFSICTLCS